MIPCPDCKRVHIHALHCPNPEPLPCYGDTWWARELKPELVSLESNHAR